MQACEIGLPLPCDACAIQRSIVNHARYSLGRDWRELTDRDMLMALSLTVHDRAMDRMIETERRFQEADVKRVYYLSAEFLIGRSLENNIRNLGLYEECAEAVADLGFDLKKIVNLERDAALGNGGLGRLAACFLDSLATLHMPGFGYGINYEYGLFKQDISNGYQKEMPDNWLAYGTPWEVAHPEEACLIPIYGRVEDTVDRWGAYNPMWLEWEMLVGLPYDMPIVGYSGQTVNYLRLYSARASHEFDMQIFNEGDYLDAVKHKIESETVSKVLYPSDETPPGRELRLVQEYFLVACAIRDITNRYRRGHDSFESFPDKVAIQINDTHPALSVAELMRLLLDEEDFSWERAWEITEATLGYTNHTLMAEALEKWPVSLFERVLPRHLQIIYEINRRFLDRVRAVWPGDDERVRRMSLIEEGPEKHVRMAHLAIVGSHSVNGVAELHTELIKRELAPDFYALWPERFNNKTNGVTQRRWLLTANPDLAALVTEAIGDGWITDLDQLRGLEPLADDAAFQERFMAIKRANRSRFAALMRESVMTSVDPASMFDCQAKRFHEYKRQLLNALRIIYDYLRVTEDGQAPAAPRTYVFAGKAASAYWAAKQIIKLINEIASVVNNDPRANEVMRVVFAPDYRVTLAEQIVAAADLSEQISTAGAEASGTGNMKFAMNGALIIGTLDGANIEIREEVGDENIFIFGLTAEEIERMRADGAYHPRAVYEQNEDVRRVLDALASDRFCPREPGLFRWMYDALLERDDYFLLADFPAYLEAQARAAAVFNDPPAWARKAILNVARIGKFSSDRSIREYARDIWDVRPLPPKGADRSA